jgi:hypothetical protein
MDISEPWYPFALLGIHITRAILETLAAGLLQQTIIMKKRGEGIQSVALICQDIYGSTMLFDADNRSID